MKKATKKEMNQIIKKAGSVNRFYSRWTEVEKKNGTAATFADVVNDLYVSVKNTDRGIWCNFKSPERKMCGYYNFTEALSFLNTAMLHS